MTSLAISDASFEVVVKLHRRSAWPAQSGSLGGNRAELIHLREDVDHPPRLGDSAVREAEDEDLVVGDGFAGWWAAHVFEMSFASWVLVAS